MIGNYLREQREQRSVGLRQLARQMGFTPGYLSKIELGECEPGENALLAYAQHLELDTDLVLLLARRVSREVAEVLARHPEMLKNIREMGTATLNDER